MKKNDTTHIYILDDLRGVAILSVVLYHYFFYVFKSDVTTENTFIHNFGMFTNFFNLGAFGVSLFFLVSGFVIPMSLKNSSTKIIIDFFIKRFFRLYPTYWLAILFTTIVIIVFGNPNLSPPPTLNK